MTGPTVFYDICDLGDKIKVPPGNGELTGKEFIVGGISLVDWHDVAPHPYKEYLLDGHLVGDPRNKCSITYNVRA